jgi:putative ABC transport system ATP-binding protein
LKNTIIALRDVRLTLRSNAGPVEILKGIDLDVARGETLGLVGPSGSGKSTLLMAIAGLEDVTSGTVEVCGHDLKRLDEDGLARFRSADVGIVFQSFHLIPTMTALENVALPLELKSDGRANDKARAELDRVGLAHRLDHYPGQLSGGEQQRVAIARAIAAGAGLVLADEPTGNLDQENGAHIIELLFALREERGATIVLVTHEPALADRCDRIARLQDGRIEAITPRLVAPARAAR